MKYKPVSEFAVEILKRNVGSTFTPHEIARIIRYRYKGGKRPTQTETVRRCLDRMTQDGIVFLDGSDASDSVYLERVSSQRYIALKARDLPLSKCTDVMLLNELGLRMNAARV